MRETGLEKDDHVSMLLSSSTIIPTFQLNGVISSVHMGGEKGTLDAAARVK